MTGPSRYLIGIDLGTTNSAVAYVDTREGAGPAIRQEFIVSTSRNSSVPVKCGPRRCCLRSSISPRQMKSHRAR